jgi:hypothetical protein
VKGGNGRIIRGGLGEEVGDLVEASLVMTDFEENSAVGRQPPGASIRAPISRVASLEASAATRSPANMRRQE